MELWCNSSDIYIVFFFCSVIEAGYMEGQQEINFITHLFVQNGLFYNNVEIYDITA